MTNSNKDKNKAQRLKNDLVLKLSALLSITMKDGNIIDNCEEINRIFRSINNLCDDDSSKKSLLKTFKIILGEENLRNLKINEIIKKK